MKEPDYYAFENPAELFKAQIEFLKKKQVPVSFRILSKKAGLKSISHLHHVLSGKKKVSDEVLERILEAIELDGDVKKFAKNLAQLHQAESARDQEFFARQIMKIRGFKNRFPLTESYIRLFEKWYVVPILEMVSLKKFEPSPSWINSKLGLELPQAEIIKVLGLLEELGLVKTNQYGRVSRTHVNLETKGEISSHLFINFHQNMIRLASQKLEDLNENQREVLSLTFPVNSKKFEELRAKVQDFYAEVYEIMAKEIESDEVCQLNIQLFPVTIAEEKK